MMHARSALFKEKMVVYACDLVLISITISMNLAGWNGAPSRANVQEMVGFLGDGREPCRIGHRHRPLDLFSRLFAPENALTWNLPFWPMSNSG